ncbi:MAG: hypothetical protein ACHQ50_03330 [Fimbriimonadales bacterium]
MNPDPDKSRLKPISLHPMSLEDALRKAMSAPVEPKPEHKPGAGRKRKLKQ